MRNLFKKNTYTVPEDGWKPVNREPVPIPVDEDVINCIIETPQLHEGDKYTLYRQRGIFYKSRMKFVPNSLFGYDVYFPDMDSFRSALVRIL